MTNALAMSVDRRRLLMGLAAASTAAAVAVAPEFPVAEEVSIDYFLAKATPADLVRYHSNALADAMSLMHPGHTFRAEVKHAHEFVLVVGDPKKGA